MRNRGVGLSVVLLVFLGLSGCQEEAAKPKVDSQVVAKVNDEELTVHQLNQVLSQVRVKISADNRDKVKEEALKKLVDQTLLLQAATKAGLDRTPDVLTQIETAKRKVLTDAYLKRSLQSVSKPTPIQVETFYNENILIFSERALFVYSQITIPATPDKQKDLIEQVKSAGKLGSLVAELKSQSVDYVVLKDAKTSEKLPRPLLKPMNSIDVGDLGFMKMSDGIVVIALEDKIALPVSLEQASKGIERQLLQVEKQKVLTGLLESLKSTASISFQGEFASLN